MIEANPPPGWISNPLAIDDDSHKKNLSAEILPYTEFSWCQHGYCQFSELQLHDLTQVLYRHTQSDMQAFLQDLKMSLKLHPLSTLLTLPVGF